MSIFNYCTVKELEDSAKELFAEERQIHRLDGWFRIKEMMAKVLKSEDQPMELRYAMGLQVVAERLPVAISPHAIFAGTQRDAFAKSYALINPNFRVASFSGYCDPTAVFGDIEANEEFTRQRIEQMRKQDGETRYVRSLGEVYDKAREYTEEVAFFIEQVTGHVIPDFRPVLRLGLNAVISELEEKIRKETDEKRRTNYQAMDISLNAVLILAARYADEAHRMQKDVKGADRERLILMERTLRKVPAQPASSLYEAVQSFLLLWQMMCMEQAPNPFAFSVGNADRIFEEYREAEGLSREEAAGIFKHFLVFFNVGDRSWAISQNILVGGRDSAGNDLTNTTTYALLDAYYAMNLPQPILSVKLHGDTPEKFYEELGRFLFTPGCLTPSFFNDDALFETLKKSGVKESDIADYAVAGCQEPLIMGKDNGNTTNSWLNLAKILELTLTDGVSLLTGKRIWEARGGNRQEILSDLKERFYDNVDHMLDRMVEAANGASRAIAELPVPFLSVFMGGLETGIDMRDPAEQGTKYNASGCLIHGLSVVADSFTAVAHLLEERPQDTERLYRALENNYAGEEQLRKFLQGCPKYGNNLPRADAAAAEVAGRISDMVHRRKNYLGNPFRADWSSPSTHLIYGNLVGATPDGREAGEMLGYGIDPLYGEASQGLGFRILSMMKLPYEKFDGGYASHFGVDPKYFTGSSFEERGRQFAARIIRPLFFNPQNDNTSPSYLYVNVTTPETLRKVLADPKKYAPGGVYIMRIHGTFVNFLDLSPEIQQDIIKRLDLKSTALC